MQNRPSGDPFSSSTDFAVFTICASNYLAHASVLGASVREHQPGTALIVFLLDEPPEDVELPDGLTIVQAKAAFERSEWNHRRCHYTLLEFATSVKPACFRYLFDQGIQRAVYLDPDIRLFRRMDLPWNTREVDADLLLTPHILSPFPRDGHLPDELSILRAGLYNLGFAGLRDTACVRSLLDWWDQKLHTLCLEDVKTGVFTDQKWMDYAPLLVPDTTILRHVGYNVAYWNLHERTPRWHDMRWQVEDRSGDIHELVFFHFSGFSPGLQRISRHENRFGWRLPGDTHRLLDGYAQALANAGIAKFQALGTPQVTFADGTAWDKVCRMLYRQATAEGLDLGDPLNDPCFLVWAGEKACGDHLTRYQRALLRMRDDLASTFRDGHDAIGLIAWMRTVGVRQLGLSRELVEHFDPTSKTHGMSVNYVGYLHSHLGVGEAARNSVTALDAAGVAVCPHDISSEAAVPMGTYALPQRRGSPSASVATILGCNADMLPEVLPKLPETFLKPYRIGYWYWETPTFPDAWSDRFDLVDEIWAGTQFIADAIKSKTQKPVTVMPPMVMPPPFPRNRAWIGTLLPQVSDEEFLFLFQFDVTSVPFRKNPEGVISAFVKAFQPADAARLVIKVLNAERAPELMAHLRAASQGRRVSFLTTALESEDRFRLLASVDCFVSLHRAEGFGLSIAEAMAYGLPVVATGWSGNVDFTHAHNAALVPYDLFRSETSHGAYAAGTLWAEPRLEDAARLMRRVWQDPIWRTQIALAGQETVSKQFSAWSVGAAMLARLEEIAHPSTAGVDTSAPSSAQQDDPEATTPTPLPVLLAHDIMRFPGYYLSRLPRIPLLLWHYGVSGSLKRAELVASTALEIKGKYRAARLLSHLRGRLLLSWRQNR